MATRSSYDFRRWRHKLHDYEFALPGSKQKPPLRQRVDKKTWEGIIHLPDDVSLRTSDYFGPQLKAAYQIANKWWDIFEDVSEGKPELKPLSEFIISNHAECEASIFNALVGYYRQAGTSLRFILEALLSGIYFSSSDERRIEFERHMQGDASVGIPYLGAVRDELYRLESYTRLNVWLVSKGEPEFLNRTPNGFLRSLYDELTEFSHGRMALAADDSEVLAFSNVEMWASNGPILESEQFLRWFDLYCATLFCCAALVRVYLLKPGLLDAKYLSAYKATMSLHLTELAQRRVAHLVEYLTKNVTS